jgi:hypothetical protein
MNIETKRINLTKYSTAEYGELENQMAISKQQVEYVLDNKIKEEIYILRQKIKQDLYEKLGFQKK